MDRQRALLELATAHAVALRLHVAGAGDEAIAQCRVALVDHPAH